MFRRLPDDLELENLDPMMKLWMYESWIQDNEEKHKFERDYTIFGGSFHNPEAAKSLMQEPDIDLSEDDEWGSVEMMMAAGDIEEDVKTNIGSKHRRARKRAMKVMNNK